VRTLDARVGSGRLGVGLVVMTLRADHLTIRRGGRNHEKPQAVTGRCTLFDGVRCLSL
jgi:hypothetical protein